MSDRNPVRRLYDWVISWADSPHGPAALGALSFAESSFFPIPPDTLLIPLVLGAPRNAWRLATLCTAMSVAGGLAGYAIGRFLWLNPDGGFSSLALWCFGHLSWCGLSEAGFLRVQEMYEQWNFWIVFVAAFTPIPYKLITITAGAFGVNPLVFTVASVIGRGARFFLVAGLLRAWGAPVRGWIDRNFNTAAIGATALLIGGFAAVKWLAG